MYDYRSQFDLLRARRQFFRDCGLGLGSVALASLLNDRLFADEPAAGDGGARAPHFAPKARNIIYLFMAGGPSNQDLFDHKPLLNEMDGQDCPQSFVRDQQFAFIKGVPRLLGTPFQFAPRGKSGLVMSELLPHLADIADEICMVRSVHTDQFNHAPAQLFLQTGSPRLGRPGMGSWVSYGLGSANRNLPSFVVLLSGQNSPDGGVSLWGSGFLPTIHQGVPLRSQGDPVLFLSNPAGMDATQRRQSLDTLRALNEMQLRQVGDPEIATRIAQFEMAYRMQTSVPEVMDISREPPRIQEMYGTKPGQRAFSNNCLLARRLVESGVRFVQLYHWGWDQHGENRNNDIRVALPQRCQETDQAAAALVKDLKQRGLLDSTLVVWGGEFGRTPMNEARNGSTALGRDHNQHAFTIWMAGGGVKSGFSYGATDELGYHVAANPVFIHDLQATILHLLGLNHEQLTYRFQGRDYRLTDVSGAVVKELLA
jgi:hypothetical protein